MMNKQPAIDMVKIGVITDEIDPVDTLMAINTAAELQLGFVDLRKVFGHSIETASKEEIETIRDACCLKALRIGMICSGYGKCPVSEMTTDKQVAKLTNAIKAAQMLNCRIVRVFPGFFKGEADEENLSIEQSREALKKAEDAKILLVVEHEPITLSRRAAFTRRLVDELNSTHYRVLFEPLNLYLSADDVLTAWDMLADVTVSIHVKDGSPADRQKWAQGGLVNGPYKFDTLGDGEFPWEPLIKKVLDSNYQGMFSIELHCGPSAALVGANVGRLKGYLGIKSPR